MTTENKNSPHFMFFPSAITAEAGKIAHKSENEKSFTNLKKQKISHKFKNAKKRSQI